MHPLDPGRLGFTSGEDEGHPLWDVLRDDDTPGVTTERAVLFEEDLDGLRDLGVRRDEILEGLRVLHGVLVRQGEEVLVDAGFHHLLLHVLLDRGERGVHLLERDPVEPGDVLHEALQLEGVVVRDRDDVVRTEVLPEEVDEEVPVRDVGVDVRGTLARGVQEPLEREIVLDRVQVRDAEDVGDERSRRRSSTRADQHVFTGEVHDRLHREEVPRELLPLDDPKFVLDTFDVPGAVPEAPPLEALLTRGD